MQWVGLTQGKHAPGCQLTACLPAVREGLGDRPAACSANPTSHMSWASSDLGGAVGDPAASLRLKILQSARHVAHGG